MPKTGIPNWHQWNEERAAFKVRQTDGFDNDMKALEAHIKKLIEVAPKDDAGWLHLTALDVVDLLKADLAWAKSLMEQRR